MASATCATCGRVVWDTDVDQDGNCAVCRVAEVHTPKPPAPPKPEAK